LKRRYPRSLFVETLHSTISAASRFPSMMRFFYISMTSNCPVGRLFLVVELRAVAWTCR
jgi:hypothetical protein